MKKELKDTIVVELGQKLKEYPHFYLVDTAGLNAEQTSDLRRKCFKNEIKMVVVKNTLLHKAFEASEIDFSPLYDSLKGNTAVMFTQSANVPAKLLKEYKKWFAWYTSNPQKNCYIWQYTDKGSVSGISGTVDINEWYESNESSNESEDYVMPQLQKGSQGKAVAVWQIIVSAIPDGTFGAETIEATKIFQREHGLLVDGIVGPKTWKEGLASL
jgi:murein L,D-transpeptidase YcbB/YkuD